MNMYSGSNVDSPHFGYLQKYHFERCQQFFQFNPKVENTGSL